MRDAWRLAAGTFLAIPVAPPRRVDRQVAARAMSLATLTTIPALAVGVGLVAAVHPGWLTPFLAAGLALLASTLLSRAMHLDGLADTADGLSASYDRERALEVMRRGDSGPSGVAAIVISLLVQVAALTSLLSTSRGALLAGIAFVASRLAPAVVCRRGVPAARPQGLGATVAGSVPLVALALGVGAVALVGGAALGLAQLPPYPVLPVLVAAVLAAWLVGRRATTRLGGITGDVIGAAIEVALGTALVAASLTVAVLAAP